jgi:hypothetical protein
VNAFERALPEIVDEIVFEPSSQAGITTLVLSEKKDVTADTSVSSKEEPPADPIDTNDAKPTKNTPATDNESEAKEQATVTAVNVEPALVESVSQDNESKRQNTVVEVEGSPLLSQGEVASNVPEVAPASCAEPQPVTGQDQILDVDVTSTKVNENAAKEQTVTPVDRVVIVDTSTKALEPAAQEVKEVEAPSEDIRLTESPVEEKSIQLQIATTENNDVHTSAPIQNWPPQTPRSVSSPKGTSSERYPSIYTPFTDVASCPL